MSPEGAEDRQHKRRTIGKDLSEREELQKTSVTADGELSSKLHYEAFSTSVAGRKPYPTPWQHDTSADSCHYCQGCWPHARRNSCAKRRYDDGESLDRCIEGQFFF
jgi:hypothetical protein